MKWEQKKFEYNKDNGLIKATDNENRETTVAYKAANTEVSETDQAANTSSFMQYDQFGNPIETTRELGTGENLIQNPSFEMDIRNGWKEGKGNSSRGIKKRCNLCTWWIGRSFIVKNVGKSKHKLVGATIVRFRIL